MRKFFSKPILVAAICIFAFILFHGLLTLGRLYGPPQVERLCGMVQGIATTPFFMESGFVIFGFLCVLIINHYRRKQDGDELVYLEVVDDPTADLSPDSKAVIFSEHHEKEDRFKIALAAIEGAIDTKDLTQAKELIAELSLEELNSAEVKALCERL